MLERPGKPPKPAPPSSRRELRRARDRRRELKRERDVRHRERVKAGKIVVNVELGAQELDWLIQIHWLTPQEADRGDARAIGERIAAGLAASAKG
jgi:hypothetical protein